MPRRREFIQLMFPRMVLISPLWQRKRYGWASLPRREGVGGEPLVNEGEGGLHALVDQVGVVSVEPRREHHALVADGAGGEGGDVVTAASEAPALDRARRDLADDEELALERIHVRAARPPADEQLADPGLVGLDALAEGRTNRPVRRASRGSTAPRPRLPPRASLRRCGEPRRPSAGTPSPPRSGPARADRSRAPRTPREAAGRGIWTRIPAPSPARGSAPTAPRWLTLHRSCNPLPDDVVTRPVADVHYEPDAARIVLVRGVVESLGCG